MPNTSVIINETSRDITYTFINAWVLGNISGYKINQSSGLGVPAWTITLANTSFGISRTNVTDGSGYFRFDNLPLGIYQLNETPQVGWTQITPNRTVEINATTTVLIGQNFNNTRVLGNISGYKINQSSALGLPGWTITLTDASLISPRTNITDSSGFFRFDNLPLGFYQLSEIPQAGWNQDTPNRTVEINATKTVLIGQNFTNSRVLGNISGFKLNATDNAGLAGWTITLANASLISPRTNITDNSGFFRFDNLPLGFYQLSEIPQTGWNQETPNRTVEINASTTQLFGQNFTNSRVLGNISGFKKNATIGMGGWVIGLSNVTKGIFRTCTTASNGYYLFENLPLYIYALNETPQAGYIQDPLTPNRTVQINTTVRSLRNQNFTNTEILGNISGYKRDPAGKPLASWKINLYNSTGLVGTVTTGANGVFRFNNLAWGDYIINETIKPGFVLVAPAGGSYQVKVNGTSLVFANLNFTNMQLGNISGIKWNDLNGNGIRDVSEPALSGWEITLKYPNGTVYGTKTTGADGSFAFTGLMWGKYNLSETLKPNWTQTKPVGNVYTVEINGTSINVSGQNFGNKGSVSCCLCPTGAYFTNAISGKVVTFTDKSTGNPVQWSWIFGDGTTSKLRNPVKTYTKAGTYTVKENVLGMKCDGSTYWVSYTSRVTVK